MLFEISKFLKKNWPKIEGMFITIALWVPWKLMPGNSYLINSLYSFVSFLFVLLINSIIYNFIKSKNFFKRYFDDAYPILGYWFEEVYETSDHPYSLGVIEYDGGKLKYHGYNFTKDFRYNARWESEKVALYGGSNIAFLFEATLIKGVNKIKGSGHISFSNKFKDGLYYAATGTFADYEGECKLYNLDMKRISETEIIRILGKSCILNKDEARRVIKEFVENKQ